MRILKRPVNVIYDTAKPNQLEFDPAASSLNPDPLHHVTEQTDYEFLLEHFKRSDHPIFNDFGNSYYYAL